MFERVNVLQYRWTAFYIVFAALFAFLGSLPTYAVTAALPNPSHPASESSDPSGEPEEGLRLTAVFLDSAGNMISNLKIALVPVGTLTIGNTASSVEFENVPLDFLQLFLWNSAEEQIGFAQLALSNADTTGIIEAKPGFCDIAVRTGAKHLYLQARIGEDALLSVEQVQEQPVSPAGSSDIQSAYFQASGTLTDPSGNPADGVSFVVDQGQSPCPVQEGSFSLGSLSLGVHTLTLIDASGQTSGTLSILLQNGPSTSIAGYFAGQYTLNLSPSASSLYLNMQQDSQGGLYISNIAETSPQPDANSSLYLILGAVGVLLLLLILAGTRRKRKRSMRR